MAEPLPRAAARVAEALAASGIDGDVREMPASTRTAEDAAAACGCPLGAIVKSLVFRQGAEGEAILILVSGSNRVNTKALGKLLGTELVRADADFVREATGYAIGGIPPLGHGTRIRTVMDPDLLAFDQVWAAAGTPRSVFPAAPKALAKATAAEIQTVT